jgi:hypothetical protein
MNDPFVEKYKKGFSGILRWPQLDELWMRLRESPEKEWYVYHVGDTPPDIPVTSQDLDRFITNIDELLHTEHKHDYCGVVYVDNVTEPTYIKIFDPNNLGVSCGFSNQPPFPGWILSTLKPVDLIEAFPPTQSRKRWFQKIFSRNKQ